MAGTLTRIYIPGIGESQVAVGSGTPYKVDTVKQYPLGTLLRMGDRTFAYCLANGTVLPQIGCYKSKACNAYAVLPVQATAAAQAIAYPGETLAAGAAGSSFVTVTIDSEIGVLTTGVLSANELAGGYVVLGNGGAQTPQNRQIVSHPALTTAGGSLTLKLDSPLFAAVTAAVTGCELIESPFYNVKADGVGHSYSSHIGIPTVVAASGEYFWCQTWGPCWATSDGTTCNSADDREIVFVGDGSVRSMGSLDFGDSHADTGYQRAGFALDMSAGATSNSPFIMLQIIP
jgi:hypothetical protein